MPPSTMLMRNTGRQPSPAMFGVDDQTPATIGPSTAETAQTGPKTAKARGSCSRENEAISSPIPCGISSAPKPPCSSRDRDQHTGSAARPQASKVRAVKPAMLIEEDPALAVAVAEPPADDQQHAHGQGKLAPSHLISDCAAADVVHDRRGGDVGDGGVHQVEDVGDQHDQPG